MSIRIVTDSTCDLPASVAGERGIAVVPCYVNFGSQSFLDGIELSRQEFYERLPLSEVVPTTSAPGVAAFVGTYQRLAAEGASGILSIHISASLSNVVNVARLAAQAVPQVPVRVIDSGQLTLGTGLLALEAARAAEDGLALEDVAALVTRKIARTYSFAALDTLEFLRRSGRVSPLVSSLGTLLSIKPLLRMHAGELRMERVRTRRKAYERLIAHVASLGPLEQLAMVHTHAPQAVEELRRQSAHLFPGGGLQLTGEVTPVIGAHVGPGAVGFVCITAG
jgi:DegV family protein with EDD domain